MKIKYLFPFLIAMLMPVVGMAMDESSLESFCDNVIYNRVYYIFHHRDKSELLKIMLGDMNNKGKYKYQIVNYCSVNDCSLAQFGEVQLEDDERTSRLNMVALALEFNNREVFETLISNKPELRYLIDSGLYAGEKKIWSNNEFLTPALNAIKNGQLGVLKYLIKNHNVNLLKKGGYMYRRVRDYPPQNAQSMAKKAVNKWTNQTPDTDRLKCAEAVQKVVEEWYAKNSDNAALNSEAEEYNNALYAIASQEDFRIENITPFEFEPIAPLDLFRVKALEENFAINIDKKIDAMIEKIMRDFDLSAFGNQA